VVRTSLFRSPYELLFVAMDPSTRHRAKAMLDVICARAGDALGSGIVQDLLLGGVGSTASGLLIVAAAFAAASLWWGRQLGALYLRSIGDQLQKYGDTPDVRVVSEAGSTLLQVRTAAASPPTAPAEPTMLSTIVGREPLEAAVRGIYSPHAGIRGLAVEYPDQVLPAAVLERLQMIVAMDPAAARP
jgi:hypothetical protein